jgi:hypothetical protein
MGDPPEDRNSAALEALGVDGWAGHFSKARSGAPPVVLVLRLTTSSYTSREKLATRLVVALVGLGGYAASVYLFNKQWIARAKINEYAESYKHSLEGADAKESQLVNFADGTKVTVNHFKSDGCNQIVRWSPLNARADGLWMFGPLLTPDKQSAIGMNNDYDLEPKGENVEGDKRASPVALRQVALSDEKQERSRLMYVQGADTSEKYREVQVGGHCLDPHPGPWTERPQPINQCSTQVWRYFPDGCIHFQWFNPCTGTWDVWPNGAPHVYWQRCVH